MSFATFCYVCLFFDLAQNYVIEILAELHILMLLPWYSAGNQGFVAVTYSYGHSFFVCLFWF